jgi:hypothetical protein
VTLHVPDPITRADARAPVMPADAAAVPAATATRPEPSEPEPIRLWVMSDLRVDRTDHRLPDPLPDFDALLVPGGIAPGLCRSVQWLAEALDGRQGRRPVVLVPGPAEYLDGEPVSEALAQAVSLGETLGITVLHDGAFRLGDPQRPGIMVLGATLWVDFALDGVENARTARAHARNRWTVTDRAASAPGKPFFPHDAAGAHARSRAYIEDALNAVAVGAGLYGHMPNPVVDGIGPGDRAVVVTAYAPSRSCLPPTLARPVLDPWRVCWHASSLDPLMEGWGAPVVWIHGNVPQACDLRLGRTRVVSNPYDPRNLTNGFDASRTILV